MTAVQADPVATDALYRWEDIITAKPSHRSAARWVSLGVIAPAKAGSGKGNYTLWSAVDCEALIKLRRLQDNWQAMFPGVSMPNRLVTLLWDAVHAGEPRTGIARGGMLVEIAVETLR